MKAGLAGSLYGGAVAVAVAVAVASDPDCPHKRNFQCCLFSAFGFLVRFQAAVLTCPHFEFTYGHTAGFPTPCLPPSNMPFVHTEQHIQTCHLTFGPSRLCPELKNALLEAQRQGKAASLRFSQDARGQVIVGCGTWVCCSKQLRGDGKWLGLTHPLGVPMVAWGV